MPPLYGRGSKLFKTWRDGRFSGRDCYIPLSTTHGSPLTSKREKGPSQCIGAFAAGYCPEDSEEEDDPGTIDPDKETNLFPPYPHDTWVCLKQLVLREGELDIAEKIVAPVIYLGMQKQTAQWEPLSFPNIKELQRAVTEHGINSLFFVSMLDSVFTAHTITPHDLRSLTRLLLTPTQYSLWEKELEIRAQNLLLSFVGHVNQTLADLTVRQLMGTGPYANSASQAWHISRETLDGAWDAARQAFLKIPDAQKPQKFLLP